MAESVRIDSSEYLASLSGAILDFEESGRLTLLNANSALLKMQDDLQERLAACERQVTACLEMLADCQADEEADCSWAAAALSEVEAARDDARQWVMRCHDLKQTFDSNLARFDGIFDRECNDARSFLAEKGRVLAGYEATGPAPSRTVAPSASSAAAGLAFPGFSSSGAAPRVIQTGDLSGIAVAQVNNKPFGEVSLDRIEDPTFQPGEWEQADRAAMEASFARLFEVQQALGNGTFAAAVSADPSLQRIFDWFYGGDSIRLDGILNGKFIISNGKHRIRLAKMLGLKSVPAQLAGLP